MLNFYVDVILTIVRPDLSINDFEYHFDYGEESMNLFKQNYPNIKFDKDFQDKYPTFFEIRKEQKYEGTPQFIFFKFEFGKFCNYYKITYENYQEMEKKNQNLLPFPIIGKIIVIDGEEEIICNFTAETLNPDYFIITFPKNDKYVLWYKRHDKCEFILLKDLSKKEKRWLDDYLLGWK